MPARDNRTISALVDQLEAEIRTYVLGAMQDQSGSQGTESLASLLIDYCTWRGRFVSQRPRSVHLSNELKDNPKLRVHQGAVDHIIKRIRNGEDLTPFLSKAVRVAYEAGGGAKKLHQRKDRDLLLADWDIHHMHLSTTVEADGFVTRAADLLFIVFHPDDAYVINIYGHGDWALQEAVEVVVRNWPQARIFREIQGVTGLSQRFSDEERLELRRAGVAQLLEVDGRVFAPPGQTTAGTPLEATMRTNELMHELSRLRDLGDDLLGLLDEAAQGKPVGHHWFAAVHDDWCGFQNGDVFVRIRSLS